MKYVSVARILSALDNRAEPLLVCDDAFVISESSDSLSLCDRHSRLKMNESYTWFYV